MLSPPSKPADCCQNPGMLRKVEEAAPTADSLATRQGVYESLCDALTKGQFVPGEKLTLRQVAGDLGVSLTPVREALQLLVANGVFEMEPNRSVRIPPMTRAKVLELRDIRLALEGMAAEKATKSITDAEIEQLERLSQEILAARMRDDDATDRLKLREFWFLLFSAARQPQLLSMIKSLWLQTGPYMTFYYPEFVASPRGPAMRERLIQALRDRDAHTVRREVEANLFLLLTYVADLADSEGRIGAAPRKPRRAQAKLTPVAGLQRTAA